MQDKNTPTETKNSPPETKNTVSETPDGLDFESTTTIAARSEKPSGATLIPESIATTLSVFLVIVTLLLTFLISQSLCKKNNTSKSLVKNIENYGIINPSYHVLSMLISSFMGLNVFFGGLTALLLNGNTEDARSYFSEISALKLSRLSHQHFFGYGISFGAIAILAFIFLGANKKRILFPVFVTFAFGFLDSSSWWLSHYVSFGFHNLSYFTGAAFASAFIVIYFQLIFFHIKFLFKK